MTITAEVIKPQLVTHDPENVALLVIRTPCLEMKTPPSAIGPAASGLVACNQIVDDLEDLDVAFDLGFGVFRRLPIDHRPCVFGQFLSRHRSSSAATATASIFSHGYRPACPCEQTGRSRWTGQVRGRDFSHCRHIRHDRDPSRSSPTPESSDCRGMGKISCAVVEITSASPDASVLQSSASKAASDENLKPSWRDTAIMWRRGMERSPKCPNRTRCSPSRGRPVLPLWNRAHRPWPRRRMDTSGKSRSAQRGRGCRSGMPIVGPTTGTPITKDPIVYPSAGAFATDTAPGNGPPPPPGLFTTAAGTP